MYQYRIRPTLCGVCFVMVLFSIMVLWIVYPASGIAETGQDQELHNGPVRIAVFPLFAEEILLEMVGPDRIAFVGHPYFENGQDYSPSMELTRSIPGSNWTTCDEQFLLSLEPDLIILTADLQDSYKHGSLFPGAKEKGIPVVFLAPPSSYDEIQECIKQLGDMVCAGDVAARILTRMDAELQCITERLATVQTDRPVHLVYYDHWQSCFAELSTVCHAASLYAPDEWYVPIDDDLIAAWNPDVIFCNPIWEDTDGTLLQIGGSYSESMHHALVCKPLFQTVAAIQANRVYPLVLRNSQYFCRSVQEAMQYIYPEWE